jgi:hypothetical protein
MSKLTPQDFAVKDTNWGPLYLEMCNLGLTFFAFGMVSILSDGQIVFNEETHETFSLGDLNNEFST